MTLEFLPTPIAPFAAVDWQRHAAGRERPVPPGLRAAFLAAGAAEQQRDRLLTPGALCVTTGQQPGLCLGPLYTLYKALSAIALARRLEAMLGRPVIPVFWVAGDDHDFAESSHLHLLTAAHDITRIALPDRAADAPLTPLYREVPGLELPGVLEALRANLPQTEFRDGILAWIERHYEAAADLATAFAGALAELLGPAGLVVFHSTHDAAKSAMRPWLLQALAEASTLDRALAARAAAMEADGSPAPVPVGDGATTVMVEGAAGRDRLVLDGGGFHTRRSGQRFTLPELRVLAERAPERFSPNVLLRPVVEAALLPTLAYVGGPGELAYLPQAQPLYDALGVAPQVPLPRWSGLVVEARVRKVLDRHSVTPADLRLPEGQLEQRLVRTGMPGTADAALHALRETIEREYPRLRDAAVAVDPTLRKPVESAQHAALTGVRDVEKRIVGHLKQQNDILVQQLAKARASLYPLGRPQERVLSPLSYLARYGLLFVDSALREVDAWAGALEPGGRGT